MIDMKTLPAFYALFETTFDPEMVTPLEGQQCFILTHVEPHLHHAKWSQADLAFYVEGCWFEFDEVSRWAKAPEYGVPRASK